MKGSRLSVADIRAGLQDLVASLDVASLEPDEATRLLEEFSVVNKSSSAAMSLLALRVSECGVSKRSGERSDADWLAKKTGEAVGVCRSALETAKNLSSSPKTDEAFRNGELSSKQANAISSAVVVSPTSEDLLLNVAKHQSLKDLQDQCDRIKATCDPDPIATQARIHKSRYWRKWTDRDGGRFGQYRLTPELGALLEKSAQPFIEQVFKESDHIVEWSKTHETTLDQLAGLCRHDHKLKTDQGHSYRQGPRGWQWHRPDGVIEYQLPPPDSG